MSRFLVLLTAAWLAATRGDSAKSPQASPAPANAVSTKDLKAPLDMTPKDIGTDPSVHLSYDIVYVRAPRKGDATPIRWAEIAHPAAVEPGSDLMLLHPDGTEEVLVPGRNGAVTDPFVSFDGEWVYYALVEDSHGPATRGPIQPRADIFKIEVRTRRIVRLTDQGSSPATPILNLGPTPVPGGRLAFVSNRNGYRTPKGSSASLQLYVMDDDGANLELVGALNLGMALHPVTLTDGRIMFSSLESQGLRPTINWGLWCINPDGSHWAPLISSFDYREAFHFQTQLSDGSIVAEEYYNGNNDGFGAYFKLPVAAPGRYPAFGPAYRNDARNPEMRFGRYYTGEPALFRMGFSPAGFESLTRFASNREGTANPSVLDDARSPRVGKFTHPSGAPDNHLLTVWSPGPANRQGGLKTPAVDAGIYLIKDGQPIDEPGQMLLIKNDPRYNEEWPRALVPYRRIYGIDQPVLIPPVGNEGTASIALPAGTPFGLVGTSTVYKRESYPNGVVASGSVTAGFPPIADRNGYAGLDPFNTRQNLPSPNWISQGAEAGRYANADIHAVRIVALEPTRSVGEAPRFRNHASERMRILGEIPLRKFSGDAEPLDPDGNPDTSFLARIPADVPFTFQLLDKNGMLLTMAQTWHQVRPGEVRADCGGCHAHSQAPTPLAPTRAGQPDYVPFDLTTRTPLLTVKSHDESGIKWDRSDETGLRYVAGPQTVEYFRDVKPILDRSCVACHSAKTGAAANLVLDDDTLMKGVPGTYVRLADDRHAQFGYKPIIQTGQWQSTNASRYIRMFQSRRSLLIWKVFGRRLDGWTNDDFPTETIPGDASTLRWRGQPVAPTDANRNRADLDYTGDIMPPAAAVAGTFTDAAGRQIKVAPLSDEDRITLVRWIDLGCPIDLDFDPKHPDALGRGWMGDDLAPTLTVTLPARSTTTPLSRILIGMHDADSGLNLSSFRVVADFPVNGHAAGEDLAADFRALPDGVWELPLDRPMADPRSGRLQVSIRDRRGNLAQVDRRFSIQGGSP